jgi:serine/threonine-protein phosphatase 4 catalytic subunit
MCDLMWSDPEGIFYLIKKNLVYILLLFLFIEIEGFGLSPRGAGFIFGGDVVEKFCRNNNIDLITRAH